ncbi:hypothetical protein AB1Y20_014751 [Prymnesium parvum]|uniref:tRNA (guanine(10)-N(2))-methyltransferase n=1 Tax=Prymnesium parvum TaxID=97485 RepID=A0AB34IF29_PRYPA
MAPVAPFWGDGPFYLCHLIHSWLNFRLAELRACADVAGVNLSIDEEEAFELRRGAEGVLLRIALDDEAAVARLTARTVLVRSVYEIWATGGSWEELEASIKRVPLAHCVPFLAEGTTFRVRVASFGHKYTPEEQTAMINKLGPLLPWKGKVKLQHPDHTFFIIVDVPQQQADGPPPPPHAAADHSIAGHKPAPLAGVAAGPPTKFYFGRLVGEGQRSLVGALDLKKRNYIGTTSLDAELSLVMANLARVRRGQLVYDPYCGTAGCLVAAAAFGARVLGADLFLPVLRGKLRTRSGPSALTQPQEQGIGLTFAQYGLPPPAGLLHADSGRHLCCLRAAPLFDAIVTDPPYGIREKPAAMDDAPLLERLLPEAQREGHVPRTALAAVDTILVDLFALAERCLAVGGRLVFLLPTTLPFSEALLPPHTLLRLEGAYEQRMAARWSRWCVVMRRCTAEEAAAARGEAAAPHVGRVFHREVIRPSRPQQKDAGALNPELLNKGRAKRKDPRPAAADGIGEAARITTVKGRDHPPAKKGARAARRRERAAARKEAASASDGGLRARLWRVAVRTGPVLVVLAAAYVFYRRARATR